MLALTSGNRRISKLPNGIGDGVSKVKVIFEKDDVKTKGIIGPAIESPPPKHIKTKSRKIRK
jgi:hypothetical protein